MGYKFEFTWLLRLPVEDLPETPGDQKGEDGNRLLWKRSTGNIILGFLREGHKLAYPVGLQVLIVTKSERVIGYGKVVKSEIYELPDGMITTVVEFSVTRKFDEPEEQILTRVFREMYGKGEPIVEQS
ncbi:MAG: hypothetical protein ACYC2T_03960 [Bacillota bacterium]